MTEKRPLILISNDDGFQAKGINELIGVLRDIADLIVVAPDGPRSGASGAITSAIPVSCAKLHEEDGLIIYKCSGTPVDCVKLALHSLVHRTPNMVIGGINHGDNSSVNVHYSGTMGVVIEGCLKGISSIGFSICNHSADADFSYSLPYIKSIVQTVLNKGLPYGTCLNVNIPNTDKLQGIRICRQTDGVWVNEFAECANPRGNGDYYWLTGEYRNNEPMSQGTDHCALDNGYVAITPTRIDVTDYQFQEVMKQWDFNV